MLYTGKGDKGTTKLFNCPQGQRISKGEFVFEALGTLDELNSSIGYAKVLSRKHSDHIYIDGDSIDYENILEVFQQNLFCIQAELGGSDIHATKDHIEYLEKIISIIDLELPPVKSFIVPGGTESGAYLDVCRTIARRAERDVIVLNGSGKRKIDDCSIAYLNRLSSALYALARFANYSSGMKENKPEYK